MLCGAERSACVSRETAPWTAATLCCSKPAINKDALRSRCSSSVGRGNGRLAPKTGATLHLGRLMMAGVALAASHTRSRISICVWGNLERAVWRCSASLFHVKQRGVFWWRAQGVRSIQFVGWNVGSTAVVLAKLRPTRGLTMTAASAVSRETSAVFHLQEQKMATTQGR